MQVSERVKGGGRIGKVRVPSHREAREIFSPSTDPSGPLRPMPQRTHLEPGADGGSVPGAALPPPLWGKRRPSLSRNQFFVLLHPLTHPSSTDVFKLPAHYRFTCRI